MNDIIAIPTVEQINLEHRLANSKASEAVQHALNCGLMLSQVKASLAHGEWLPWLKQQQESGLIGFSHKTATKYMNLAANMNHGSYLTEATSIRAALELLTDKDPEAQQGTLIDVETERQARAAAEAKVEAERQAREQAEQRVEDAVAEWKQRSQDWHQQFVGERDKLRQAEMHLTALEKRIDYYTAQPAPEPVMVEKEIIPPDYEALKAKAAQLETELATTKAEQNRIIQSAIKAKLSGYQGHGRLTGQPPVPAPSAQYRPGHHSRLHG